MTMLDAGAMDRRIRIERPEMIDDGHQTRPGDWEPLATVWAHYLPARGQEAREMMGREATLPATFRVRWRASLADLGAGDRLRFPAPSGAVFDIQSAVEIGRREGIEIVAVAGDDADAIGG